MDKLMPIDLLFDLIDEEPMAGAKEARKRGKGVRLYNWETGASAFALARRYSQEPKLLSSFYSQEFWDGGYEKDPTHLLRHFCQFVLGARTGSEAKRGENWASAMQPTFDETTTTPEKLLEMLKKGGFDGLRKAAAPPTPSPLPQPKASTLPTHGDDHKKSNLEEDDDIGDGDDDGSEERHTAPVRKALPSKAQYPKMSMKEVFEHLLIAVEPGELGQFLAASSEIGDRHGIMVERQADDPATGMLVWRAVEIK